MSALRRLILLTAVALFAIAPLGHAQVTTGTITGVVSAADGSALPGVTVEAIHVPTGTRYDAVTGSNGRFTIPNVRVGGPYRVAATLEGFRAFTAENVTVPLGASADVPATLQLETVSESITVTATTDDLINPNRTGATSTVSEEQLEALPTVNRTLQDFARTNPYVNVDPQDISATRMTVAGKNNRYNSIAIDGAVNNDLFGLADTGTPGGQADALAISLDAIQEIQVAVSPYDVRQGGFTGGGINAITRSGTNDWEGSLFYSKRDPEWVGDGPFENSIAEFESEQYGGRFGGRILRDKLFFFINGEKNSKDEIDDYSGDGSAGGTKYPRTGDLELVENFLNTHFGYDPGGLGAIPRTKYSDNFFGRVDWNANSNNQFTLRHNYVKGAQDIIQDRNTTRFRFPKSIYFFEDETNSTVAQLNSTFGGSAFNEARVNLTTISDQRATPGQFPGIEIGGTGPRSADIIAGAEQFSTANSLDQDILELTDDFTFLRGAHNITVGTHNEFFEFNNVFMSSAFGHYYYPTLDDFLNERPSRYFYTYAEGGVNPAQFQVKQYGLYASDQWTVRPNVTLTFGLRADTAQYPDSPAFNPVIQTAVGYDSSATPQEEITLSPRFGFNWQIGGAQQLRGGVGVFAGRTPYVWVSNAYGGTGIGQISLECSKPACTPTFEPDPSKQPTSFPAGGAAFAASITDPDFKAPRLWRATLAYDRELPFGIRGSVEGLYSKTIEDVYYQNVNYVRNGVSPLDGRPRYQRNVNGLTNAFLLTNTDLGDQLMGSIQLNKNFGQMFTLAASYAHQDANSAFDGGSSTASSNWGFHHTRGDIYEPELSRSAYETTHRINISGTAAFSTGFITHNLGLYYNVNSGRPYSLIIGTDVNGDGATSNDLLYIPADGNVIIQKNAGSNWTLDPVDQFRHFLEKAGAQGTDRIMDRYELTEPWTRQLDLHYDLGLPAFGDIRTALTADVSNILAMVNNDYGTNRFVSNQNYTPVTFVGLDSATGKPIYRERAANALADNAQFTVATDRSRWQARLGVRVSF